jgi:hypothetical protein
MRKSFIAILLLSFCSLVVAQQALNNDSVIKLTKAGLSDDLVVSTINASPGAYNTSADGLIALKKAGVSDKVIAAILTRGTGAPAPAPAPAAAAVNTNPDDPNADHEPGIYLYDSAAAKNKMVGLDPSSFQQARTSGVMASAFTYGIKKAKVKSVLQGAAATVRTKNTSPVFYFYFGAQTATTNSPNLAYGVASTPKDCSLVRLEVNGASREMTIGSASIWGASSGTQDADKSPFNYEKIRPGVFKVTLVAPLPPGEYGFNISAWGRVYDFGVDQ